MQAASRAIHDPDCAVPDLTMEDHQMLIAQVALRQDRDAFKSLFQYFGPRVKSVMLRAGADHEFAEDLVQEVMMTVWRKARLYAPERGPVSTWIYTIARNARIDRLRRASSQPYLDLDEIELASGMADGEDRAFASQRAEHVARALDELPDEQRRIIEYAYVHDMAQSEIAAKLELPLGTVKSRMRLAYTKLKGKLEVLK